MVQRDKERRRVATRPLPALLAVVLSALAWAGPWPNRSGAQETIAVRGNEGLAEADASPQPMRLRSDHLPNLVQIHPRVISGGLPEGDAAFAELADRGIKTVISVDGAKPDVQMAARHGLRYVHLPHGYEGISETRARQLAKAVDELEGPIYVHCHHGKHRSPAAAAVACVGAGLLPTEQAAGVLRLAGTDPHYLGLYRAARRAEKIGAEVLAEMHAEFPETAEIPPMAEAMVRLETTYGRLQRLARAGWQVPADSPDLDPAHVALILREHYTELLRTDDGRSRSAAFQEQLREAEATAKRLELAFRGREKRTSALDDFEPMDALLRQIRSDCKRCHQSFRDVPPE